MLQNIKAVLPRILLLLGAFSLPGMAMAGSEFITIFVCDLEPLKKIIGSKDQDFIKKYTTTKVERQTDLGENNAVRMLVNKEYSRDPKTHEHPDGHLLIYAVKRILQDIASDQTVMEVYVDVEETPELWNLVIGKWDKDPFQLPLSPYGKPVIRYLQSSSIPGLIKIFKGNITTKLEYLSEYELDNLLGILESAKKRKSGVFIFYEE